MYARHPAGFFIGGNICPPTSAARETVHSPADGSEVGSVPVATADDVDRAVAAARQGLASFEWISMDVRERAQLLCRIADALESRATDIAACITAENGVPIAHTAGQSGAERFRAAADLAASIEWEVERQGALGPAIIRREPIGVAALIIPWNSPVRMLCQKLASALLTGCTVVAKPAAETPLSAYIVAEALRDAGVPDGVVNILPGSAEIGARLVAHPGVDKVSFTGSVLGGSRVAAVCGEQLKRCTLELGGKSAAIVLDDADLAAALPVIVDSYTQNNGQACTALGRVLAPKSIYNDVVDGLAALTEAKVVGDPVDPATEIGPLVSGRQRARLLELFDSARAEGARFAAGGRAHPAFAAGWYVEPTVIADATNSMRVAREELFGPATVVIPVDDVEDAISIAGDSDLGLAGAVFTSDRQRGLDVARRVSSGTFGVNVVRVDAAVPFGGIRRSGLGRELGVEGVLEYTELKTIYL